MGDVMEIPKQKSVFGDGSRVRQEKKPLMNRLELEAFNYLSVDPIVTHLRAQSLRLKLANGAWYKPDISGLVGGKMTCWECKGGSGMKGAAKGILALKVAATTYPEMDFFLVWKDGGQLKMQKIIN